MIAQFSQPMSWVYQTGSNSQLFFYYFFMFLFWWMCFPAFHNFLGLKLASDKSIIRMRVLYGKKSIGWVLHQTSSSATFPAILQEIFNVKNPWKYYVIWMYDVPYKIEIRMHGLQHHSFIHWMKYFWSQKWRETMN